MAFQPPIFAPSRPSDTVLEAKQAPPAINTTHQAHSDQSREWVLFPNAQTRPQPQTPSSTTFSPQTAALSRLSELGSLGTAAPFDLIHEHGDIPEDDEELDSLDEGLHAFHEQMPDQAPTAFYHDASILPTHDGLGTFPASSHPVQEHLWHFERFNPRRRSLGQHRRRSSVQRRLDASELHDEVQMEKQTIDRIERWRTEHSQFLLEEVEKETRRMAGSHPGIPQAALGRNLDAGAFSPVSAGMARSIGRRASMSSQDTSNAWDHIVRKLVKDLLGVDEMQLAVISGEALMREDNSASLYHSSPDRSSSKQSLVTQSSLTRNLTFLDRLSQEILGILRQFSYVPVTMDTLISPINLDYAGLPVTESHHNQHTTMPGHTHAEMSETENQPCPATKFNPTLQDHDGSLSPAADFSHAALWGIEEEPERESTAARQEADYWQQTLSIRTVFRILHQHFSARRRPLITSATLLSSNSNNKTSTNIATISTADSLRRAAVIRKHHPLISSSQPGKRVSRTYSGYGTRNMWSSILKRSESSCASAGARNHRRGSGSSRNYWDLGGSIDSGSLGGIGVWGEV
ncbi:MAG: hypothetical protein LQ350_007032 [Teloschistes chrysophthalmus]|nr:MAG: hypothetical protein LQ350_007032 [Niorma chrysophthalma]